MLDNGKIALFMLHTHLRLLYNKDNNMNKKILTSNYNKCWE